MPERGGAEFVRPHAPDLQQVDVAEYSICDELGRDGAGAAVGKRVAHGDGVHVAANRVLAVRMLQRFGVGAVVGAVDLVKRSPDPRPEQVVGAEQLQMAEKVGADFLSEFDDRGIACVLVAP